MSRGMAYRGFRSKSVKLKNAPRSLVFSQLEVMPGDERSGWDGGLWVRAAARMNAGDVSGLGFLGFADLRVCG